VARAMVIGCVREAHGFSYAIDREVHGVYGKYCGYTGLDMGINGPT
jgi:hypothetical protein